MQQCFPVGWSWGGGESDCRITGVSLGLGLLPPFCYEGLLIVSHPLKLSVRGGGGTQGQLLWTHHILSRRDPPQMNLQCYAKGFIDASLIGLCRLVFLSLPTSLFALHPISSLEQQVIFVSLAIFAVLGVLLPLLGQGYVVSWEGLAPVKCMWQVLNGQHLPATYHTHPEENSPPSFSLCLHLSFS